VSAQPPSTRPCLATHSLSWSRGEELANSLSHGFGFIAALIGAPILLLTAQQHGGRLFFIGAAVFCVATLLLYFFSTLQHALPHGRTRNVFVALDQAAIFLLIAGTYTPFLLGVLRGPWGWSLFAIVWALAAFGVLLKTALRQDRPKLTVALYVAMGWLIVIAKPLWTSVPRTGLLLLVLGGLAYTGGLVFYGALRFRYHHLLWHLCALLGTACHYFAVLWYAGGA